jgi:hypothetical protein
MAILGVSNLPFVMQRNWYSVLSDVKNDEGMYVLETLPGVIAYAIGEGVYMLYYDNMHTYCGMIWVSSDEIPYVIAMQWEELKQYEKENYLQVKNTASMLV